LYNSKTVLNENPSLSENKICITRIIINQTANAGNIETELVVSSDINTAQGSLLTSNTKIIDHTFTINSDVKFYDFINVTCPTNINVVYFLLKTGIITSSQPNVKINISIEYLIL
jgi:hypothetical protein